MTARFAQFCDGSYLLPYAFSCDVSESTNQFPRKYLTSVWEDIVDPENWFLL